MTTARCIVFIDRPDWHSRQLGDAFTKAGVEPIFLSLRRTGFAAATGGARLRLPGFEDELPLGAFVRTISAGSFEQVTLRLGVLHALRESGLLVYNDARAIERCVDKSMTSFLLHRAGIPTPPTWAVESREAAQAIARAEASPARPLVLKPLFGSQGRGLALIEGEADLPPAETVAGDEDAPVAPGCDLEDQCRPGRSLPGDRARRADERHGHRRRRGRGCRLRWGRCHPRCRRPAPGTGGKQQSGLVGPAACDPPAHRRGACRRLPVAGGIPGRGSGRCRDPRTLRR